MPQSILKDQEEIPFELSLEILRAVQTQLQEELKQPNPKPLPISVISEVTGIAESTLRDIDAQAIIKMRRQAHHLNFESLSDI